MGLPDTVSFITALFAVFISVGGFLAIRQGYTKQLGSIQVSVIEAQEKRDKFQKEEIADCARKVARMERAFRVLQKAFKRRGITIEIDGDTIYLIDEQRGPEKRLSIQIPIKDEDEEEEDV
jgi:hypothetical protein